MEQKQPNELINKIIILIHICTRHICYKGIIRKDYQRWYMNDRVVTIIERRCMPMVNDYRKQMHDKG